MLARTIGRQAQTTMAQQSSYGSISSDACIAKAIPAGSLGAALRVPFLEACRRQLESLAGVYERTSKRSPYP